MNGDGAQRIENDSAEASGAVGRVLDVLYVSPGQFRASPQRGVQLRVEWDRLAARLSTPRIGNSKDVAGAWSPAFYRGGIRRKSALIGIGALVVDVDNGGDVDRVIHAVGRYRTIVHDTFSSTPVQQRCRIIIHLDDPIDARLYERLHAVVRAHLHRREIEADAAAKDASRLSYLPVRSAGSGYRFATSEGASLNASRVLAMQPTVPATRVGLGISRLGGAGEYSRAALMSASSAVASAGTGTRNSTLFWETFSVARLVDLGLLTIKTAMLDGALAAGLPESEAKRTIASALRARRGAQ